ncbi:DUF6969 family protein [Guyparkeria halopsychrophila]|uniref:DUF6969 family protein n=1 Tax=Guyparkeria halopsychrophila TaxID=3139421 RepID=UPI0037C9219F
MNDAPSHRLPEDWLDAGLAAIDEWGSIQAALAADNQTVLTELFRDHPEDGFDYWAHFPPDDARDPVSAARFYYHAHEPAEWTLAEHGHFHLFIADDDEPDFAHVVAVSMDSQGRARRLFTTNAWVTGETVRSATELLARLPNAFEINRSRPSWLVGRWLTALVALLMPQIRELLEARDRALTTDAGEWPDPEVLADRDRHVLSECPLDMGAIRAEWSRRLEAMQSQLVFPPG